MSVFTKEAFQMSSMPAKPPTPAPASEPTEERESGHNVVEIDVEAVLLDLDGTLINTAGAEAAAWKEFSTKYDVDLNEMLRSAHGMRAMDALKKWCKLSDPAEIAEEVKRFEKLVVENAIQNEEQGNGIEVLPGVHELLAALGKAKKEDAADKWTIVTSSTYAYASRVLESAELPVPKSFITADSVTKGKPSPDAYFQAAALVDASIFDSLVIEDSPTGIRAGKQSGARVIAVATSHPPEALEKERPDFLITDLRKLQLTWDESTDMFKVVLTQPVGRPTPRPTPDSTPLVTPAGSRAQSFSSETDRMAFFKSSDELTGNDSVVGSPIPSRASSPQPGDASEQGSGQNSASVSRRGSVQGGGISLDAFKRAMAGNARKNRSRTELDLDE